MFNVKGLDAVLAAVSPAKVAIAERRVDREIGDMAREMANKASAEAPVLTGRLKNSLAMSARRNVEMDWDVPVDLENVPYVWRQNFEHQTKGMYITRNFNIIESQFADRLQKVVDSLW